MFEGFDSSQLVTTEIVNKQQMVTVLVVTHLNTLMVANLADTVTQMKAHAIKVYVFSKNWSH